MKVIKVLVVATGLAIVVAGIGIGALLDRSGAQALPCSAKCEAVVEGSTRIERTFPNHDRCDASPAIEPVQLFGPPPFDPPLWDGRPAPTFAGRTPYGEPRLSPRRACDDGIHRHAALVGYMKSKLRLQGNQKDAWHKIEQASEPVVESMHQLCAQLPDRMVGPAAMPEMIEFAEKQLSARAALFVAILEPLRSLYELLSPEQRAALEPPPPPARY